MITTNNKIFNYQFVSLQANAVQERYYFPDLPNLRNVNTYRIVAYTDVQFSRDINNVQLVTMQVFNSSYITINSNGVEIIQKLDLNAFSTIVGANMYSNSNGVFDLKPVNIDFSKSFVQLSNGAGILPAVPFVYAFGIYYSK
jgi:hypothetical protein